MIRTYLAVMAAGAAGTGARMFLAYWVAERFGGGFPWGTLLVNVLGCSVIGAFSGLAGPNGPFPAAPFVREIVMIGFLGGFTTFSSFSLQTLMLCNDGKWPQALAYVALSLGVCLLGAWGGLTFAGLWQPR